MAKVTPQQPASPSRRQGATYIKQVEEYGAVRFHSSARDPALWAVVPPTLPEEDLRLLVMRKWKQEQPSVLISVACNDHELDELSRKNLVVIERAICEVVKDTKAWMLTSGVDAGVSRVIGRMLREMEDRDQVVCMGVVAAQRVAFTDGLRSRPKGEVYKYPAESAPPPSDDFQLRLEQNHSHFLMVDAGASQNFAALESDFRFKLQNMLGATLPMVMLVMGGDLATLHMVKQALDDKRPVVVLPDTGGAALQIYEACFVQTEARKDPTSLASRPESYRNAARAVLKDIKHLGERLTGGNKEPAVTFYRVHGDQEHDDLKSLVMKALLNDLDSTTEAIRLAVKWQKPDIIRFQLQESKEDDRDGLATALEDALLSKSVHVVKELLHFNASCSTVRLDELFNPDYNVGIDVYQLFKFHNFKNVSMYTHEEWTQEDGGAKLIEVGGKILKSVREVSPNCAWGFAVLIDLLEEHISVDEALDVRASRADGLLQPTFFDLMMWAVLVREVDIARELWGQTEDPLRATLVASLLCRQIAVNAFDSTGFEADRFFEDAAMYEEWAVGLLDEAERKEARIMLLATDSRFPPGTHRSVLELATEDFEYACKRVLEHRHCKAVVQEVYRGFRVQEVPDMGEEVFEHPVYADVSKGEDWLDEVEYSSRTTRSDLLGFYWPQPKKKWRVQWRGALLIWQIEKIFTIPMVKFCAHSLSSSIFLLLFTIQLCGWPWTGKPFMWLSGTYQASGDHGTTSALEYVNWFWTVCRCIEESKQMIIVGRKGYLLNGTYASCFSYFKSFENWLELFLYSCIFAVACMRVYVESYYSSYTSLSHPGHWDLMLDWCRCLYAVAVVLAFFRFIEVMKVDRQIGVLYIALLQMTTDIKNWFIINIFIILGFGIAFTVLMPGLAGMSDFEFGKPVYMALLALLGDFNLEAVSEYYAARPYWDHPTSFVMPVMLMLYVFIAAVVLVNLLIALMSARYEKLSEKANEIWLYERLKLYEEYKDERASLPPPLNFISVVWWIVKKIWKALRKCSSAQVHRSTTGFKLPKPLERHREPPPSAQRAITTSFQQLHPLPPVGTSPVNQQNDPPKSPSATGKPKEPLISPEAQGVFEAFDVDRRNALDVAQLRAALASMGINLDTEETAATLARYDTNANNLLELGEFNMLVADIRRFESDASSAHTRAGGAVVSQATGAAQRHSPQVHYRHQAPG
ncbi:hypothetical protein AB1Y20_012167 [Prymnesium parvum]|uniref:EF-hand domain-containing protein n=1 Tax=Prymnesium parvum TaxID=97485 RepID=A0AB34IQH5_PRYPA